MQQSGEHFDPSIQICNPSENERWNVADLWQESFNDSPEYIEFFFNRVYKPENTFVIKRNGFIVSAVQMIPYKAKFRNEILPVAYICGACTHPFERGKGLMQLLMHHVKSEMIRRGFPIAIVIPAEPSLFNFYRRFGFNQLFFQRVEYLGYNKFSVNSLESRYHLTFEACTLEHFQYFNRKQHALTKTILHDASEFETILQELNCDGGKSYVALENQLPVGIASAERLSKDTTLVKVFFADSERICTALCKYAFRLFEARHIKIYSSNHSSKNQLNYGLACNLDNKKREFIRFRVSLMHD